MIKTAVIGVGHLGSLHCKAYKEIEGSRLVGIYDIDKNKSKDTADRFNVQSFKSLKELLENCDAVSIATPTTEHFKTGICAVQAHKHILMEKPITATIDEAEELLSAAEKERVVLQVGHIERFNPAFKAARDYVDKPLFIEAHRLTQFAGRGTEVDVILDLMIHDIDLILKLVGEEPGEIRSAGAPVLTKTSDIANVRLEFPSGCTANITASRISAHPMRKMRIFQKAGYIAIDFADRKTEIYLLAEDDKHSDHPAPIFRIPSGTKGKSIDILYPDIPKKDMLQEEIRNFILSIEQGIKPEVDGNDGLRALKVAIKIIEMLPEPP